LLHQAHSQSPSAFCNAGTVREPNLGWASTVTIGSASPEAFQFTNEM
jgi:hypothetical protein